YLGVDHIDRFTGGVGRDLLEDVAELHLVFLTRDVAEMRRAHHVAHAQQRMVGVEHRLFFVDIDCREARTPSAQRIDEGAALDEWRAAGVDDERGWLHPRKISGGDDAARGINEAYVQGDDVAFLEERLLARSRRVAVRSRAGK